MKQYRRAWGLSLAVIIAMSLWGCGGQETSEGEIAKEPQSTAAAENQGAAGQNKGIANQHGKSYDFFAHFSEARQQTDNTFKTYYIGTRHVEGKVVHAIHASADNSLTYSNIVIKPGSVLEFGPGFTAQLDPQKTDGAVFIVRIQPANGPAKQVYRRVMDPQNNVKDREVTMEHVPLNEFAGQTVSVTFEVTNEPGNNKVCDWTIWAAPKLVWP